MYQRNRSLSKWNPYRVIDGGTEIERLGEELEVKGYSVRIVSVFDASINAIYCFYSYAFASLFLAFSICGIASTTLYDIRLLIIYLFYISATTACKLFTLSFLVYMACDGKEPVIHLSDNSTVTFEYKYAIPISSVTLLVNIVILYIIWRFMLVLPTRNEVATLLIS